VGVADLAALGNQVLFSARLGAGTAGLWKSDGTAAGTRVVKGVPWPQGLTAAGAAGSFLYFTAGSPTPSCFDSQLPCRGLWRTDGTRAGTRLLKPDVFFAQMRAVDGGRLFFAASGSTDSFSGTGIEPWVSDGTAAGTHLLADLNQRFYNTGFGGPPFVGSSSPEAAVRTGAALLFAADDGISGRELWATDLTAGGTRLVSDINPRGRGTGSPAGSYPGPLVPLGGISLFAAYDGTHGRELWASDGTAAGTRMVGDLLPGPDDSSPHDLTLLGGRVYFLAADPQQAGSEALWVSDGTAAGTRLVAPLTTQEAPALARSLTAAGGRLFFVVDDETVGSELWTSDGTAGGSRLVSDLRPGPAGSYPQRLTAVDGRLVFAADDGVSGLEPWVSDGTAQGTRRLGDLAPGLDASSPGPFVAAGSFVFFGAWDPVHGRELWAVPRAALAAP
jgi:ELWxxDGT repeat protein